MDFMGFLIAVDLAIQAVSSGRLLCEVTTKVGFIFLHNISNLKCSSSELIQILTAGNLHMFFHLICSPD